MDELDPDVQWRGSILILYFTYFPNNDYDSIHHATNHMATC